MTVPETGPFLPLFVQLSNCRSCVFERRKSRFDTLARFAVRGELLGRKLPLLEILGLYRINVDVADCRGRAVHLEIGHLCAKHVRPREVGVRQLRPCQDRALEFGTLKVCAIQNAR